MPLHILKQSGFTYQMLTDSKNDVLSRGIFPDSLQFANISPVHKKDDATNKENCRPVSVLPSFSKIFEKVIYDQLSHYLEKYLNIYYAVFGKLIPHNMFCSNYYNHGKKNEINLILKEQF